MLSVQSFLYAEKRTYLNASHYTIEDMPRRIDLVRSSLEAKSQPLSFCFQPNVANVYVYEREAVGCKKQSIQCSHLLLSLWHFP